MIVLVDTLMGDGAPFRILRRADVVPHDVILLAAAADASVLSTAIMDLVVIRAESGDTIRSGVPASARMRVRRPENAPARGPRELPWAQRVLNDLRRAQPRDIPGVGTIPAVEIWLPPQRGKPAQPQE